MIIPLLRLSKNIAAQAELNVAGGGISEMETVIWCYSQVPASLMQDYTTPKLLTDHSIYVFLTQFLIFLQRVVNLSMTAVSSGWAGISAQRGKLVSVNAPVHHNLCWMQSLSVSAQDASQPSVVLYFEIE